MRSMIQRLQGYLDRKGLEFNTEKTKIMRLGQDKDQEVKKGGGEDE